MNIQKKLIKNKGCFTLIAIMEKIFLYAQNCQMNLKQLNNENVLLDLYHSICCDKYQNFNKLHLQKICHENGLYISYNQLNTIEDFLTQNKLITMNAQIFISNLSPIEDNIVVSTLKINKQDFVKIFVKFIKNYLKLRQQLPGLFDKLRQNMIELNMFLKPIYGNQIGQTLKLELLKQFLYDAGIYSRQKILLLKRYLFKNNKYVYLQQKQRFHEISTRNTEVGGNQNCPKYRSMQKYNVKKILTQINNIEKKYKSKYSKQRRQLQGKIVSRHKNCSINNDKKIDLCSSILKRKRLQQQSSQYQNNMGIQYRYSVNIEDSNRHRQQSNFRKIQSIQRETRNTFNQFTKQNNKSIDFNKYTSSFTKDILQSSHLNNKPGFIIQNKTKISLYQKKRQDLQREEHLELQRKNNKYKYLWEKYAIPSKNSLKI